MARGYALRGWVAALLLLPSASAWADMRGDIQANINRCGALSDDRQWLDCVYGSVQPMRARLGLPPASEGQIRLSGAQSYIAPPSLPAGPSAAPPPRSYGLAAPPASAVAPGPNVPGPGFGLRQPAPPFKGVVAKLTSYTLDNHGRFTVTLANGQVWRQLSGDTTDAHWDKAKSSQYVIKISNGFFDSFNLEVEGQPERYKVQRLQ